MGFGRFQKNRIGDFDFSPKSNGFFANDKCLFVKNFESRAGILMHILGLRFLNIILPTRD